VPAVNLRERLLDRVDVAPGLTEFHLVGDRMRPRDHEIVHVLDVVGGGGDENGALRPCLKPFRTDVLGRTAITCSAAKAAAPRRSSPVAKH
jgi:type VI protein secretion system component VasA